MGPLLLLFLFGLALIVGAFVLWMVVFHKSAEKAIADEREAQHPRTTA
jgi:hypothetical protein